MGIFQEFRDFINRGNVVDLAVGVIIGAAFGKIVNSLVDDIIMPPIGLAIGGVSFTNLALILRSASGVAGQTGYLPAVTVNYGIFIQTLVQFLIIAFAVFSVVKLMNVLHAKKKADDNPTEPEITKDQQLLIEIRDSLQRAPRI